MLRIGGDRFLGGTVLTHSLTHSLASTCLAGLLCIEKKFR
jgi:hypothetical protein